MKIDISTGLLGVLGSIVSGLFGGWSYGLTVLMLFMLLDMVTGMVAALFNKSTKTKTGGLSSEVIWRGIAKKVFTLVIVIVGAQLDHLMGANYIRDAVTIAYIITEVISIIENAGLIGLPIPPILLEIIEVLKEENKSHDIK